MISYYSPLMYSVVILNDGTAIIEGVRMSNPENLAAGQVEDIAFYKPGGFTWNGTPEEAKKIIALLPKKRLTNKDWNTSWSKAAFFPTGGLRMWTKIEVAWEPLAVGA